MITHVFGDGEELSKYHKSLPVLLRQGDNILINRKIYSVGDVYYDVDKNIANVFVEKSIEPKEPTKLTLIN